ncbi:sialoadhesin-like [Misgurnus anguillicaudatus]|uniref:sialoadhesin-like n=1 Tax=Misgurnus anguillicaudatus TaxID=75329 RepID=UPI003CCF5221
MLTHQIRQQTGIYIQTKAGVDEDAINTSILSNVFLTGVLLYETLAWEVRMPSEIHGLKGSCLVIPCSYSYTSNPPNNPHRVVWYQWVSRGYPLVYDPWYTDYVIYKFRGKTDIYNPTNSDRDCSLLIKSVNPSHNGDKIYAWIDPDTIGWRTYKFYDVTSTIIVYTNPQQPIINISGGLKIGDSITVACYTLHTCPYSKPNIILNGIEGSDKIDDVRMENGRWKITLTRTGVVKAERSDIECTVTHHGGITTRATKSQSAKCVHYNITIEPKLAADIIEGVYMNFTCTVHHSCLKNPPILSWNFENMSVKNEKKLTGFELVTFSTITFLGEKKDDGKKLICTANISGQKITASVDLHLQRVHSSIIIEPKLAADIIEGVDMNFTCTVHHSCQMNPLILSWNYENMPVKDGKKQLTGFEWATFSTITFLGAKTDDGKKLICATNISGQKITASVDLHVQQSPKPVPPVQDNISVSQNEPELRTFDMKTIGFYILAPSFAFLLICIFAGVIIYKNCNRSSPANPQESQSKQRSNDLYAAAANIPSPKSSNDLYASPARIPSAKRYCPFKPSRSLKKSVICFINYFCAVL